MSSRRSRRRVSTARASPMRDVAKYGRVVDAYYAAVDRILGQWMRRAEEDGAVLLVHSDHGFKWGKRPPLRPGLGRLVDGGVLAPPGGRARGLGARACGAGSREARARLVDVAPTVLALLDVPGGPRDDRAAGRGRRSTASDGSGARGSSDARRRRVADAADVRRGVRRVREEAARARLPLAGRGLARSRRPAATSPGRPRAPGTTSGPGS